MPTIPQTQTVLYSYFMTGDAPTQNEFQEFIGTMFYLFNEAVADAAAAASSAGAAAASAASVVAAKVTCTTAGTTATIQGTVVNVASVTLQSSGSGTRTWRITFTSAMADIYYKPFVTAIAGVATVIDVATGYIDVQVPNGAQFSMGVFA